MEGRLLLVSDRLRDSKPVPTERQKWAITIPDQSGCMVVVTGANAGIGYYTALGLAKVGAKVLLACRDPAKGRAAAQRISAEARHADVRTAELDLADLASVQRFADDMIRRGDPIDLLINSAGIMMPPNRGVTKDGFELQFGTNHLGHFALTSRLLPLLRSAKSPRVVSVSSGAYQSGRIDFDDLQQSHRRYSAWRAYAQSKLANLLFTQELQRRSTAQSWRLLSVAAHPGYARTELLNRGQHKFGPFNVGRLLLDLIGQSAADGPCPACLRLPRRIWSQAAITVLRR